MFEKLIEFLFDAFLAKFLEEGVCVLSVGYGVELGAHIFYGGGAFGAADGFHAVQYNVDLLCGLFVGVLLHVPKGRCLVRKVSEEEYGSKVFAELFFVLVIKFFRSVLLGYGCVGPLWVVVACFCEAEPFEEFLFEFHELLDSAFELEFEHREYLVVAAFDGLWFVPVGSGDAKVAGCGVRIL